MTHLSDTNGVVGKDVVDRQFREGGNTHGCAHVVGEHEESGAGAAVKTEVRDAVEDRSHGVLTDAIVEVAASVAASRDTGECKTKSEEKTTELCTASKVCSKGVQIQHSLFCFAAQFTLW